MDAYLPIAEEEALLVASSPAAPEAASSLAMNGERSQWNLPRKDQMDQKSRPALLLTQLKEGEFALLAVYNDCSAAVAASGPVAALEVE